MIRVSSLADLLGRVADGLQDVGLGPFLGPELLVLFGEQHGDVLGGHAADRLVGQQAGDGPGVLVGGRPGLDFLVGERADADDDRIGAGLGGGLLVGERAGPPANRATAAASAPSRNSRFIVIGPFLSPGGWSDPVSESVLGRKGGGGGGRVAGGGRPTDIRPPLCLSCDPPSTHFTPSLGRQSE